MRPEKMLDLARFLVLTVALAAVCAAPASAQVVYDFNDEPVEVPLAYDFGVGGRAMGMGGAHVAVVEDASAIYYNPAGLAMIRRIELGAAFTHQHDNVKVNYRGSLRESPLSSTKLHQVALAYPVPTYRGSFVLGFGYHRIVSLDRDYYRAGPDVSGGWETESITDRGGLGMYSIAAAIDASPDISIGASLSLLGGSSDTDYYISWTEDGGGSYRYSADSDIDGVTGSVGMLYKFEPIGRFGLTVDFPRKITLNGTFRDDETDAGFEDKITLPFSLSGGIAITPPNFVFAADVKITDWSQIDYEGPIRVFDQEGRRISVYKTTAQVRLGAEALLPNAPVRLRAGYYYDPIPYKLFFTDNDYYLAEDNEARDYVTFGGGVILENALSLDVAFVTGGFVRSAQSTVEDTSQQRVFISAAYRY
jgi:long-subunit fatty acid transport protein